MMSISMGLFDDVPLHIAQRRAITQIHPCARVASPDPNWGSLSLGIKPSNLTRAQYKIGRKCVGKNSSSRKFEKSVKISIESLG
jgi:hypothetical protein